LEDKDVCVRRLRGGYEFFKSMAQRRSVLEAPNSIAAEPSKVNSGEFLVHKYPLFTGPRRLLLIRLLQQAPMYWGQILERSAAPRICL
jgi:hypothetical protein